MSFIQVVVQSEANFVRNRAALICSLFDSILKQRELEYPQEGGILNSVQGIDINTHSFQSDFCKFPDHTGQLTSINNSIQRDKDVEKVMKMDQTKENKARMQEARKQLLDTSCGHLQNENLKQNAKLVQFLKARQNVLGDIRNHGSAGCSTADESRR
ncbi:Hypothetical predicted protein, partial [Paramuricea clavata]